MNDHVVFVSFPVDRMSTLDEAKKRFSELSEKVIDLLGSNASVEIIDYMRFVPFLALGFKLSLPAAVSSTRYLALSEGNATDVYFSNDYERSSACLVERKVAEEYGMRILDER